MSTLFFVAVTEHTTAEPASEPEPETELLPPNSISELPEKLLDSGVYLPGRYIPLPPLSSARSLDPVPGFPFSPTHNSRLSLTNSEKRPKPKPKFAYKLKLKLEIGITWTEVATPGPLGNLAALESALATQKPPNEVESSPWREFAIRFN